MKKIKSVHFIGIGGAGMGAIAEVLLGLGYFVSGSDVCENSMTKRLAELGARVTFGHFKENIFDADVIVVSTAIDEENIEIKTAREHNIPIVPRAKMLADLMHSRYGIAVAGTHGKTTSTSILSSIMQNSGVDPSYIVGGKVLDSGTNARLGHGKYLIAEADESDASFLYLKPTVVVVTNIDADHLSTYNNDLEYLKKTFIDFINSIPLNGIAVLCIDNDVVRSILPEINKPYVTYGFAKDADYKAGTYLQYATKTKFTLKRPEGKSELECTINMPGKHNVLNAVAAIAVATEEKLSDASILSALARFKGVSRRFQLCGDYNVYGKSVSVVDDYAHHPIEVKVTVEAAFNAWPDKRLILAYQPHKYTRTRDLFNDFVDVLKQVDVLFLVKEYSAGESPIIGADSKALYNAIAKKSNVKIFYVKDAKEIITTLLKICQDGDVLITQGAGSIGAYNKIILDELKIIHEDSISQKNHDSEIRKVANIDKYKFTSSEEL